MLLGVASMFSGRDFGHWASNRGRRRRLPPSRGSDAAVNRCGSVQSASAALLAARTASEMCVWTGDRAGEADALSNLGLLHGQQGQHRQAIDHFRQALTLYRRLGNRAGEAEAHNGLGEVLWSAGDAGEARTEHSAALTQAIETGYWYEQVRAHDRLAYAYQAAGERDSARDHWQRALALHAALGTGGGPGDSERVGAGGGPGDCESEDIRANLAALDGAAPNRDSTVGSPHVR